MTPDVLLTILKIAGVFVAVSFVVFWVGLVWWVSQDVLTRTKDKIIVSAAVGLTAILGPVGILIYLVVRPRQTLKERYGEMMEQEMLLQASAITICPTCQRIAQNDFVACPHCGTTLKKGCTNCGKLLDMEWVHCPFCGTTQQPTESVTVTETITPASESLRIEVETARPPSTNGRMNMQKVSNSSRAILTAARALFAPVGPPIPMPLDLDLTDEHPTDKEPSAVDGERPARRKTAARKPIKKDRPSAKKRS
jgi:RNA polymerase subunit RPABC4/transcription elongation factor Spt4